MKFGSQLRSKSVPEWRSYNIDYNELKLKIRLATQENTTQEIKDDLYKSFIEQIDLVNLFLSTKMGEIKRRTIYVEELVEAIDNNPAIVEIAEPQLTRLSQDLQKLSRFIVIQKTALRKLLKKYTKYSKDGGELNTNVNKYMIKNPTSFIHTDLSGFYLELSLIYDLIREKKSGGAQPSSQPRQNSNRRSSYSNPIANLSRNDIFDFQFVKEGNYIENYLVHYDNLAELKLFLLSNFFFVDDTTSHQVRNMQLMKQQSTLSLKDIINKPFEPKVYEERATNGDQPLEDSSASHISNVDVYRSNSIYLNKDDPLTNSSFSTQILLDDPKQFQSIKSNTDPGYLITDLSETNANRTSFLISAIGGLRKCSNVSLDDYVFTSNLLKAALNNESFESFYTANEQVMSQLDSLERVSIEWLFTKHIKPVLKVKSTKARFSTSNIQSSNDLMSNNNKFQAWISLTSNLEFANEDMNTTDWTVNNELNSKKFPYAHLCIRYNSHQILNKKQEGKKSQIDELLSSHLIYKIDNSFSMLTYSLFHYNKLSFEPTWANLFTSEPVDIRKLPPKVQRNKSKSHLSVNSDGDGSTSHKHSVSSESTANQFRYWNEFDHGSDFEDDACFLVPVDSNGETDFQLFSDSTIDSFYKASSKMSNYLNQFLPYIFDTIDETGYEGNSLNVNSFGSGYGSVPDEETGAGDDSDNDSLFATRYREQRYKNDKFKLFLSLASSILSDFLTFVSLLITFTLFSHEGIVIGNMVFGLLVTSMVISLFFASLSLVLLLNTEDMYRNIWQTGFVWTSFISVSFLIILGFVRVFEV